MNDFPKKVTIRKDFVNETFLERIELKNVHPKDVHIGLSMSNLFDRIIKENITSSSFYDEIDYEYSLFQMIYKNYNKIKNILRKIEEGERFEVSIDSKKAYYGIRQTITADMKKTKTYKITAFFEKDSKKPYKIKLITIFPDISPKYAQDIKYDLTDDLRNSKAYKEANALTKLYFDLTLMKNKPCHIMNTKIRDRWNSDTIVLEKKSENENIRYQALISNKKVWWKEVIKNPITGKWKSSNLSRYNIITLMLKEEEFVNFVQKTFQKLKILQTYEN